jgi:hypothetical protein
VSGALQVYRAVWGTFAAMGAAGSRWRHHLLARRQLASGGLAFRYRFVPKRPAREHDPADPRGWARVAGRRPPGSHRPRRPVAGLETPPASPLRWYHQRTRLARDTEISTASTGCRRPADQMPAPTRRTLRLPLDRDPALPHSVPAVKVFAIWYDDDVYTANVEDWS